MEDGMRKSFVAGVAMAAVSVLPVAMAAAQSGTPWLHVRVEEARKASKVHVNLPLTVVEAALKSMPELIEEHGCLRLGNHHQMKLADFRRVWKELAAVGDAELVSVESDDENVKVMRKGDLLQVFVDKKAEDGEKGAEQVRVEVPVSLVDALLSGEGDEVNVQAAVAELRNRRGDIVQVHDDDSHVRVWIDEQNAQPNGK
jgi:hypothetical protein